MPVTDFDMASGAPVWRRKVAITVAQGATNAEADVVINGTVYEILFVVPDLEATGAASLKLQDEDNKTWYDSGALAEAASHLFIVTRLLVGVTTIRIECNAAQTSAARNFVVYLKGVR